MGQLTVVRKDKKRTVRQDAGRGAAIGAAGYAAASPRHYGMVDDALGGHRYVNHTGRALGGHMVREQAPAAAKVLFTGARALRGAALGAAGGLAVNALRRDQKETASKGLNPFKAKAAASTAFGAAKPKVLSEAEAARRGLPPALKNKPVVQGFGKSHGVGRHLTRDPNSSPGSTRIRTPSLRDINGKFAGMGYGVKHFTPMAGTVRGAVHTKSVFRGEKKPTLIGKAAEEPRKGMLGAYDLGAMQAHAGSRVGRRIPK